MLSSPVTGKVFHIFFPFLFPCFDLSTEPEFSWKPLLQHRYQLLGTKTQLNFLPSFCICFRIRKPKYLSSWSCMLGSSLFSWFLVLLAAWGCRRFLRQSWSKKKVCLHFFHYVCRRYCFFSWNGTSWILVFLFSGFIDGPTCLVFGWKCVEMVKKNKKESWALGYLWFIGCFLMEKWRNLEFRCSGFVLLSFIVKFSVSFFFKQIFFLLTWAYIHVCAHIFKQKLSPMSFKVNK